MIFLAFFHPKEPWQVAVLALIVIVGLILIHRFTKHRRLWSMVFGVVVALLSAAAMKLGGGS